MLRETLRVPGLSLFGVVHSCASIDVGRQFIDLHGSATIDVGRPYAQIQDAVHLEVVTSRGRQWPPRRELWSDGLVVLGLVPPAVLVGFVPSFKTTGSYSQVYEEVIGFYVLSCERTE
eukprot:CAMPEP_0204207840 /NCGR_PEP_ID=MMETSP0361-20130328/72049_1 /ASSEMBLY_ACC=CAM_ASM_000343 /TAXON_ID=268821 /ORGANISM="Scrippsiella Hangoei, Strain SHTV-5" /LENGTH=117 /DNA_ID=CAMNT_0051171489 /DNA_START=236 /DNA_END=590 /DNA_ORIENTATION=-